MDDPAGCDPTFCNLVILEDSFQGRVGGGSGGIGANLDGAAGVASHVPDGPLLSHCVTFQPQ